MLFWIEDISFGRKIQEELSRQGMWHVGGEARYAEVLVENPEIERQLGRSSLKRKDNIKRSLK
jgi:hypothetical protein